TPEVDERGAVTWAEARVVDVDRAVDDHGGRRLTETRHRGVVTDLEVQRVGRRAVGPGLEQQRVALAAELVRDLLARHPVHGRLDVAERHGRVEDQDVWSEVRLCRWRGLS